MSATHLSRERIAELRRQALELDDAQERDDALALLDAYERQRPRPASEVPSHGVRVLGLTRSGRHALVRYEYGGLWHDDAGRYLVIDAWWPLPKGGEK